MYDENHSETKLIPLIEKTIKKCGLLPYMLWARQFLQKTTVARGPRTGLFARKNESIEFSEFKFGI